jgi:hypothetical protein
VEGFFMRMAAIALTLFVAGMASPALAQTSGWQVSEVSGDVRAVVDGQTRPVTRGMLLASGSAIASGANARAVLVNGRDYVILSPSSRVRVPGTAQVIPASATVGGSNMTQILTEAGTALFRIEHRPNPHFRVQTPYLAAVVKGTVFSVTVSSSGASVQVTQGAVQVSTVDGGAAELVRPGMVATVESGDLMELNIQGEVNRSIRSAGTPLPGVATVPVAAAGRYDGPADTIAEVAAPVREDPVSLSDATDGLVSGQAGADLAMADLRDETRPDVGRPAGEGSHGQGNDNSGPGNNNGGGNDDHAGNGGGNDNSGPGHDSGGSNDDHSGNGGGNDNSGPGNNNGGGNDDHSGNGGGNDNSGPGNNNGGGNDDDHSGNGGGNDNSGPGNNNGGGNDDSGDGGDEDNSGHGGGGHGRGGDGGLNVCLPADLACISLGGRPR